MPTGWASSKADYWRHAKPLLVDGAMFLTVLAILLVAFVVLKIIAAAGYDEARVHFIKSLHFYTFVSVQFILACDVIGKLIFLLVRHGKDDRKRTEK